MRKLFILALLALPVWASAHEGNVCTTEPKEKWMDKEKLQEKLKAEGYEIKKFKVLEHCYEIYGKNKEGQKVEIYFNPVDGSVFKEEVD